jgi:hypothetical protein
MKTAIPFLRRSVLLLSSLVVLFTASCSSTSKEVGGLVSASDATLSSDLNRGVAGALGGSNVADVSRRIDAFIAAHPDQKTTNASLRVRQAVMLLQNKQTNLAEAAFNQAALADLKGSTRDEALKRLQDTLIWYHRTTGSSSLDGTEGKHYQKVTAEIAGLTSPADEDIRDYLAAVRAWIGIKHASLSFGAAAATQLTQAINDYAATLPPGETAGWETAERPGATNPWPGGMTFGNATTAESRRHFRALDLIEGANSAIALNAIAFKPTAIADPYFRSRLK